MLIQLITNCYTKLISVCSLHRCEQELKTLPCREWLIIIVPAYEQHVLNEPALRGMAQELDPRSCTSRVRLLGFLCRSSKPGDSNDKRHHPCHHHHYHQPENPHDHGLKGDHVEGFPRFLIFPVAEETSHVDGAAVLLQYCSTPAVLLWCWI